jgi:hypothetical protein
MIRPSPAEGASGFFVSTQWLVKLEASKTFAAIVSSAHSNDLFSSCQFLKDNQTKDCQNLLRCSRQEVVVAREVALRLVAAANPGWERIQVGSHSWRALLH